MPKKCCKKNAVVLLFSIANGFNLDDSLIYFYNAMFKANPSTKCLVVKGIDLDFSSSSVGKTLNCGLAQIAKCYNIKNVVSLTYSAPDDFKILEVICCKYRNKFLASSTANALEYYAISQEKINRFLYTNLNQDIIAKWEDEKPSAERSLYMKEVFGILWDNSKNGIIMKRYNNESQAENLNNVFVNCLTDQDPALHNVLRDDLSDVNILGDSTSFLQGNIGSLSRIRPIVGENNMWNSYDQYDTIIGSFGSTPEILAAAGWGNDGAGRDKPLTFRPSGILGTLYGEMLGEL